MVLIEAHIWKTWCQDPSGFQSNVKSKVLLEDFFGKPMTNSSIIFTICIIFFKKSFFFSETKCRNRISSVTYCRVHWHARACNHYYRWAQTKNIEVHGSPWFVGFMEPKLMDSSILWTSMWFVRCINGSGLLTSLPLHHHGGTTSQWT